MCTPPPDPEPPEHEAKLSDVIGDTIGIISSIIGFLLEVLSVVWPLLFILMLLGVISC